MKVTKRGSSNTEYEAKLIAEKGSGKLGPPTWIGEGEPDMPATNVVIGTYKSEPHPVESDAPPPPPNLEELHPEDTSPKPKRTRKKLLKW